jgi:hypothetical protein
MMSIACQVISQTGFESQFKPGNGPLQDKNMVALVEHCWFCIKVVAAIISADKSLSAINVDHGFAD